MTVTNDHFDTTDGTLSPQPWMQLRRVVTDSTVSVFRTYGATGGQNKNEVLQNLTVTWTNNTPTIQYVYGLVHHGSSAVSLQARSRGYLQISHAMSATLNPKAQPPSPLVEVSRFGGGADTGVGGLLGIGTDFAMHEVRAHSSTVPLMPHITGWLAVSPGHTVTAQVEVRFISERWESTSITNGRTNTDCTVQTGNLAVDLFAVPVIEPAPTRDIPVIIGSTVKMEPSKSVTVATPAGSLSGDVLVAIVGNNFGDATAITAPSGWVQIHAVNDNQWDWFNAHVKVYVKPVSADEPASHTFTNSFGAEQIVHLLTLRGAITPSAGTDSNGWAVASTRTRWTPSGNMHVAPSMATDGQLLICASIFGLADNIFDGFGIQQVDQNPPAGMTQTVNLNGASTSMCVAALSNPTNPTQERVFTTQPRAYFSGTAVTVTILVAGRQLFS